MQHLTIMILTTFVVSLKHMQIEISLQDSKYWSIFQVKQLQSIGGGEGVLWYCVFGGKNGEDQ